MKKKVEQIITVDISICNICGKEVTRNPHDPTRLAVVRGLGKTGNFDAHETCLNRVMRAAFKKYL